MQNINANTIQLHYAPEAVIGTAPCDVPYNQLRVTGDGPKAQDTMAESAEVTGRGVASRPVRTGRTCESTVNFEYSASDQFKFMVASAFGATGASAAAAWSAAAVTATITVDVAITGGVTTLKTAGTGFNALAGLKVNQWIRLTGFTTRLNNGIFQVKAVDLAADPQVITVHQTLTPTTGETCKVTKSAMVRNGSTVHTCTMLTSRPTVGSYESFLGMHTDAFSLTVGSNAIITGSWGTAGIGYEHSPVPVTNVANTLARGAVPITGATIIGSDTFEQFVSSENVEVLRDHSGMATDQYSEIKEFSITLSGINNAMPAINSLYDIAKARNTLKPTLSCTHYYKGYDLLVRARNAYKTPTSWSAKMGDSAGNAVVWSFPQTMLGGWEPTNVSNDAAQEGKFGDIKLYDYTDSENNSYIMQADYFPATV